MIVFLPLSEACTKRHGSRQHLGSERITREALMEEVVELTHAFVLRREDTMAIDTFNDEDTDDNVVLMIDTNTSGLVDGLDLGIAHAVIADTQSNSMPRSMLIQAVSRMMRPQKVGVNHPKLLIVLEQAAVTAAEAQEAERAARVAQVNAQAARGVDDEDEPGDWEVWPADAEEQPWDWDNVEEVERARQLQEARDRLRGD